MFWGSHKTPYMFWVFNVEKGTILNVKSKSSQVKIYSVLILNIES